jgi:tRNA A-37 threonylcarbamoyl transferase component Bud32
MKDSTWWNWLWSRISGKRWREKRLLAAGGGAGKTKLLGPGEEADQPGAPSGGLQEDWLDDLIGQCADGLRLSEVGGNEFWKHIDELWNRGDELLAGQWIEKFLMFEALDASVVLDLRLRLVRMFEERGDLLPVMSHLDELTRLPEHASDAHFRLAEHYRRRGEEVLALREYEAVLARDVDYPNVRQRYERLRAQRGELGTVSSSETIVGAGSGAASDGNRYLLVRELGRGAAGVAYLARDMQLEREVAVKLLHPHLAAADQQSALRMFFDEARVAASLRHPNIVAILDLDVKARRIVMELCDGGTLRAVLRDRGPRPLRRALERHAQILSALDAAHARGVVHRDLKPANLMFRRDPDKPGAEVVLGDFGIAHLPNVEGLKGGERAVEGRAVGTMAYMSPEQRRGEVTEKSDLYASAVVLFEMLTGRYPWSREQLLAGTRRPGDFALPASLRENQPQLGAMLQAHLDALGDPTAANRPETTMAMKEARRLRDLAMIACRDGDPSL